MPRLKTLQFDGFHICYHAACPDLPSLSIKFASLDYLDPGPPNSCGNPPHDDTAYGKTIRNTLQNIAGRSGALSCFR